MAFPRKNNKGKIQLGKGRPTNETLIIPAREYMTLLEARGYAPESVRKRWGALRRFLLYLEARNLTRVQEVTMKVIEDYRKCLVEHDYSASVHRSDMCTVKLFFRFLEEKNIIFDNPVRNLVLPHAPVRFGTVLTEKEVRQLLAGPDLTRTIGVRDRAVLEVLYSTGIRRAEAQALTIFDVDLERKTLRVKGKGRKQRLVPLGKQAVRFLRIYLKEARPKLLPRFVPPPEALWLTHRQKPLGKVALCHIVIRYAKKAEIPKRVNAHALRRTCATHLLRGGAHPVVVAQILGHANLTSLSHYLQTTVSDLMKVHAQLKPGK